MFSSSRLHYDRKKLWTGKDKILPGGESNPGLPRDRRGYSSLYYQGFDRKKWNTLKTNQQCFIKLPKVGVKQLTFSGMAVFTWVHAENNSILIFWIR